MMHDWWPRIVILSLLGVIVGVPLLFSRSADQEVISGEHRLVIISPHNEQIRFEYTQGFNRWRRSQGLPAVQVNWRSSGGTSDLRRQVISETAAAGRRYLQQRARVGDLFGSDGLDSPTLTAVMDLIDAHAHSLDAIDADHLTAQLAEIGLDADLAREHAPLLIPLIHNLRETLRGQYDLFFGGGEYDHNVLARGTEVQIDGHARRFPVVDRIDQSILSDDTLREIFPEDTLGGERLYHPDRMWIGTALSSFGIIYNNDVLPMIGLPAPTTWADLAAPEYAGWVALADPNHSGSIAATYNTILRRAGWTEGWQLLQASFANARYFTDSAGKVPVDVSHGQAAAGMCIDFFGRYQAGAVRDGRVGYVDPSMMTAITADPITLLRNAPNREIAEQFIVYVVSKEGQRLWQRPVGSEGGTVRFELRRLPIRYDMYRVMQQPGVVAPAEDPRHDAEMDTWVDHDLDPWSITRPFPPGTPDWFGTVAVISSAMAIDNHDMIKKAWHAIHRETDPDHRAKMLEVFHRMPPRLTLTWPDAEMAQRWQQFMADADHPRHAQTVAHLAAFHQSVVGPWRDPDQRLNDRLEWTAFFRNNYREVLRMQR